MMVNILSTKGWERSDSTSFGYGALDAIYDRFIGACRTVKVPGQRIIMSAREVRQRKISVLIIFISRHGDHLISWLL